MFLSETAGFFFSLEDAGEPHTRSVMNGDDSRQLRLPPLWHPAQSPEGPATARLLGVTGLFGSSWSISLGILWRCALCALVHLESMKNYFGTRVYSSTQPLTDTWMSRPHGGWLSSSTWRSLGFIPVTLSCYTPWSACLPFCCWRNIFFHFYLLKWWSSLKRRIHDVGFFFFNIKQLQEGKDNCPWWNT